MSARFALGLVNLTFMKNNKAARITCLLAAMLVARSLLAVESGFTEADARSIKGFLKDNFVGTNVGMVVGLLDEHGSKIFSSGVLDNGTDQEVNGDTVFEIGSITKTFTALTLMDLVEHGEMKLDEPVANFLPATVKVPAQGGKTITLLNLAAQDSGLPFNATNFSGADWKEQ